MRSGWGPTEYPTVVGHEIVGKITKVGSDVKDGYKVGDIVGIGAQCDSCEQCEQCKKESNSYCDGMVGTYSGKFKDGSGRSMGGYASKWRGPATLAIPIPDGLDLSVAAPLLCGGATAYSPLRDYGCGQENGKRVAIVGVGGIGAFGLNWAKALGADEIVAISTTASKKDLAMQLGATDFLAMKDDPEGHKKYRRHFDIILNTAADENMDFDKFVFMLRPRGHLINIAVPEKPCKPVPIGALLFSGANIGGSAIAGRAQLREMLDLAVSAKPNFMIEKRKMSEANEAVKDMVAGKPRFRYTLMAEGQ